MPRSERKDAAEPYVMGFAHRTNGLPVLQEGRRISEALLAWFTGKPRKFQEPLLQLSGPQLFAISMTTLFASACLAGWLLDSVEGSVWKWPPIIFLLLVVVGRLRALGVVFVHHASHGAVSSHRWVNRAVSGLASAIALVESPSDYKTAHVKKHHRNSVFTTESDPDAMFLLSMGFKPGMTKAALWRQLAWSMVSIKFHATFLEERLKSALLRSEGGYRLVAIGWLAFILILGFCLPLSVWLIVIVLPMTLLYQVSALLQFLSEHPWLASAEPPRTDQEYMERCWARFCGDPIPTVRGLNFNSVFVWSVWIVRLLMHAVVRVSVLVGDLPVHDVHHLTGPMKLDLTNWRTAIFDRQKHIDQGDRCKLGMREIWGLDNAIDRVFQGMASRAA